MCSLAAPRLISPKKKKSSELYAQSRLDSTHYTTFKKELRYHISPNSFTMGKKSKSQSTEKSQAVSDGPSLLGGSTLDPTLASLFDKSVCFHI